MNSGIHAIQESRTRAMQKSNLKSRALNPPKKIEVAGQEVDAGDEPFDPLPINEYGLTRNFEGMPEGRKTT